MARVCASAEARSHYSERYPRAFVTVIGRVTMAGMTKDKFQVLCERILVPRMGDLLHRHLAPVHETLDILAAELARIERTLNGIATTLQGLSDERDAD